MGKIRFPVSSLQIYFSASLELQEELLRHGFQVPRSKDGKIKTPIPIIYANFRGWLRPPDPITIERLIPPEWYGMSLKELGWSEAGKVRGRRAYKLPQEEVYVDIEFDDNGNIVFILDVRGYHLERTSIRGINPEKWTNWAMFYILADYLDELIGLLEEQVSQSVLTHVRAGYSTKVVYEEQQGGKEKTYYVKVPVVGFSLCLGCFDLALRYLTYKAKETGLDPSVVKKLRLRLEYDPQKVKAFAKVGVAKISGKKKQVMIKLASEKPKITIRGILKDRIEGKARGKLVYCGHTRKIQKIVLPAREFYLALSITKKYLSKLPED